MHRLIDSLLDSISQNVRDLLLDPANWRKCSPDFPPCAVCKQPTSDVLLRITKHAGTSKCVEVTLHPQCAFPTEIIWEYDIVIQNAPSPAQSSCSSCATCLSCAHVHETMRVAYKLRRAQATERVRDDDDDDDRIGGQFR